jgi:hypothetical protein
MSETLHIETAKILTSEGAKLLKKHKAFVKKLFSGADYIGDDSEKNQIASLVSSLKSSGIKSYEAALAIYEKKSWRKIFENLFGENFMKVVKITNRPSS